MEVPVCWLTTQVVHLLLLQQADGIVVYFQHQLCLWVLAGHSLTAEDLLRLDHLVLLCACQKKYGNEKPENIALWPLKVRSVHVTMLKWTEVPGYGLFLGKVQSCFSCSAINYCRKVNRVWKVSAVVLTDWHTEKDIDDPCIHPTNTNLNTLNRFILIEFVHIHKFKQKNLFL